MANLDPSDNYVVLINTFTVDPSRSEELVKALADATEQSLRQLPGFVSANLHVSDDGKHVANYAQWATQADLDSMMATSAAQQHIKAVAEIAESFEPIYYTLRESYSA